MASVQTIPHVIHRCHVVRLYHPLKSTITLAECLGACPWGKEVIDGRFDLAASERLDGASDADAW